MDRFNNIQKELIEKCERAHEAGIRNRGLSGTICEDLLIEVLKKEFPRLNFQRGVISYKSGNTFSPQIDVIIFKGKPLFKEVCASVVSIKQVVGIIEVKKWLHPKGMQNTIIKLNKIRKELGRIPTFLIAFRFKDRNKEEKYFEDYLTNFKKINSFCFYGNSKRYPWEEIDKWKNFNKNHYADYFRKLINRLHELEDGKW